MLDMTNRIAYRRLLLNDLGIPYIEKLAADNRINLNHFYRDRGLRSTCSYCLAGALSTMSCFNAEGLYLGYASSEGKVVGPGEDGYQMPVYGDLIAYRALGSFFGVHPMSALKLFGNIENGPVFPVRMKLLRQLAEADHFALAA